MTNAIAINVTKNCHSEKVRYKLDCYNLYKVLLAIILLLIITLLFAIIMQSIGQNKKILMH